MALSDFNKTREVLKIKNYKEFIAQEKLKKPELNSRTRANGVLSGANA